MKPKLAILLMSILLSSNLIAQEKSDTSLTNLNLEQHDFKHAISICPIALVLGEVLISYEYLLNKTHGLAVMLDYQSESATYKDPSFTLDRASVFLNYRYHFSKKMNSIFFGPYLRARFYDGEVDATGRLDFNDPEITLGLYLGKRWVWNNGLNVTLTGGYGPYIRESREDRGEFKDKYFGELSIGYAF